MKEILKQDPRSRMMTMRIASYLQDCGQYQLSEYLLKAYMTSDRELFEQVKQEALLYLMPSDPEERYYREVLRDEIKLPVIYRQLVLF